LILIIDNFDSFTYNLVDCFKQLGCEVIVRRNNEPAGELEAIACQGVVLSPGPGKPKNAGRLMEIIAHYAGKRPMLGICLGHQAIAEYFGATLVKALQPMHGKVSQIHCSEDPVFNHLPAQLGVVRYHSLVCCQLPGVLKKLAWDEHGEIMAFRHNEIPIYGLQFHPEAVLTQFGLDILRNWINLIPPSD
jgi:anthranilate synthase/aminodeoxychorismate synthase-like glutamine amidotransferase